MKTTLTEKFINRLKRTNPKRKKVETFVSVSRPKPKRGQKKR